MGNLRYSRWRNTSFLIFTTRRYASVVYVVIMCSSIRPSVHPSVTSRTSTKTVKHRITQTTPYDRSWRTYVSFRFFKIVATSILDFLKFHIFNLSPPKDGTKRDFAVLPVKFNFCRIKSAKKLLCVKTSSGEVVSTSILYLTVYT